MIAASVDDSPHLRTLKRVGIVTLAVGLADVVFMVYCLANGLSYSSSFNIFAVAAGILLIRGSLAAAEWTRFFATFTAAGFGGLILIWPAVDPRDSCG